MFQDAENEDVRPPLQLEWFSILERNYTSNFRTIQYESSDRNTVVTHEGIFRAALSYISPASNKYEQSVLLTAL